MIIRTMICFLLLSTSVHAASLSDIFPTPTPVPVITPAPTPAATPTPMPLSTDAIDKIRMALEIVNCVESPLGTVVIIITPAKTPVTAP